MTVRAHDRPPCDAEHGCITCSDAGVPMRVVEIGEDGALATCVDDAGGQSEVMLGIVGRVTVGDTLLVHAATALLRLEPSGPSAP